MRRRIAAFVAALALAVASVVGAAGAADASAKRVQYACRGNGYTLIVDSTWAYFLWNQGWNCRRTYWV